MASDLADFIWNIDEVGYRFDTRRRIASTNDVGYTVASCPHESEDKRSLARVA